MRKKNEMNKDEMAEFSRYWFEKNFKTQIQAAEYFKLSRCRIANIVSGREMPNRDILLAMGYSKECVYRRVK